MDNFNQETMNNIKNLVDNGNISDAISKISPEMIENFSKMLNSNDNTSSGNTANKPNFDNLSSGNSKQNASSSGNTYNSNFDFSKLDMNTILKMKSAMEKMNNSNNPRSNLLYSLKPYLRHTKQEKLDQYVNLLNFSQIADILKNEKKDDKNV